MKTARDPRHQQRIKIVKELFSWEFNPKKAPENEITKKIVKNLAKLDQFIKQSAPAWPVEKINRIDLAILRLAVYELMVRDDIPSKVVVDEAIEIAKEYGSQSSPAFINGALGKLIQDQDISTS